MPRGKQGLLARSIGSFCLMASSVLDRGVRDVRMKCRVVSTCSIEFVVGVDKELGVLSLEFENFEPFLHAQSTFHRAEGLHAGD